MNITRLKELVQELNTIVINGIDPPTLNVQVGEWVESESFGRQQVTWLHTDHGSGFTAEDADRVGWAYTPDGRLYGREHDDTCAVRKCDPPVSRFKRGDRVWNIQDECFGTCVGRCGDGVYESRETIPIVVSDGGVHRYVGLSDDCYLPASEAPVPKPGYVATEKYKEVVADRGTYDTPEDAIASVKPPCEFIALFALSADGTRIDRIPDEAVKAIRERGDA